MGKAKPQQAFFFLYFFMAITCVECQAAKPREGGLPESLARSSHPH